MAEEASSGGNSGLYFIVGGLVVAVAIGAFAYQGGYIGDGKTTIQQTTTTPAPDGTSTTTTTTKTTP